VVRQQEGSLVMLLLGMILLGLLTFAAMIAFVRFCERV
jgi:hypothetical protein